MGHKGAINTYVCHHCRAHIVTRDLDEGTTAMLVKCVKPGCNGTMHSNFYSVDQKLIPTHEWYKPADSERAKLNFVVQGHVLNGGLLLRPIQGDTNNE